MAAARLSKTRPDTSSAEEQRRCRITQKHSQAVETYTTTCCNIFFNPLCIPLCLIKLSSLASTIYVTVCRTILNLGSVVMYLLAYKVINESALCS